MNTIKKISKSILLVLISLSIGIIFCELILRVKHHYVINYDIEMWKYAKKLKQKIPNNKINHIHINNKSALLQKTEIKINNQGQRDIDYDNLLLRKYDRRFLILGSSVALGWGVDNDKTFTSVMNNKAVNDKKKWIFINGGVGNYNTERYVNNYFQNWKSLEFTDIIIHFFVNDTELIQSAKTNFFTENLHLGVVLWKLVNSYVSVFNPENITEYYKKRYEDDYKGFIIAKNELKKLSLHCQKNKINCHIILMPDLHKLKPYKLDFINKKIYETSKELNLPYFDLLNTFNKIEVKKLWNKYNDPHPNNYAHNLMGNAVYGFLNK
tara:strand:- start:1276 stop:2247 length:972 start_codon:yes stop_codon:yes gene_type:complete